MRLLPLATILWILTPAVLPEIFTGLRVGFSLTLLGVLIGEMFASQRGLGFLIVNGINLHNVPLTTAGCWSSCWRRSPRMPRCWQLIGTCGGSGEGGAWGICMLAQPDRRRRGFAFAEQ